MARTKQTVRRSNVFGHEDYYTSDEELDDQIMIQYGSDVDDPEIALSEEEKQKRVELENSPMQCELKYLEKRWTKRGTPYITEPIEDEEIPEQKVNWHQKFALCITNQYDRTNKVVAKTTLHINSAALKDILKDVIGNYPGQTYLTRKISVDFPADSLYHYRTELKESLGQQQSNSEGAAHLPILIDFIEEQFHEAIVDGDNLRAQGMTTYEHLWTIFKPGTLVYSRTLSQPRVYKLLSYQYHHGEHAGLQLNVEYVDYDGVEFGARRLVLFIYSFTGATPITELDVFPLSFHEDSTGLRDSLIKRGRTWETHAGQHFRHYRGIALDARCNRYNIDGRIMIDTKSFHRTNANLAFTVLNFNPDVTSARRKQSLDSNEVELIPALKRKQDLYSNETDLIPNEKVTLPPLTDEQALLATPIVRAFSLTEKIFLDFFIDNVSPIEWNTSCFDQLVLPESQKELVQALVTEHTVRATDPESSTFDDIVKGKGRGLILVLHGPPGVGKTLTAECVAEVSCRPLYTVSSGELGTSSADLDERLTRILDLASTWKAVLLIDEADVFLERRSLHDMERNSMVSIFLRTLEYYGGILFMTTNRVRTFDDALKSRIHVPLKYEELPASSRRQVWKNFISKIECGDGSGEVEISEDEYDRLAVGPLNGRQIKNVVRTAKSLANYKKRKLDYEQLETVMKIQMEFERDLDADLATDRRRQNPAVTGSGGSSIWGEDREVVMVERN